jgi:anthranilate synthase component 1
VPDLPRFTGGAVGYFGYGASSWFEPVLGDLGKSDDGANQAAFMVFDTVLAFDHVRHRILIIANARITADDDLESLYQFACAKIQFLERELERGLSHERRAGDGALEVRSSYTREGFEEHVRTAKEHIAAGDIYQVVLSQRFEADVTVEPFTVYRALRHVNPSPYMYFIRMGGVSVVGSSPEMLVRVEGSRVETHPIAGTRPRGRNPEEDMRLGEELKRNEKERAEHVMLVDLGRNDVGRVCKYGTVRVPQFAMQIIRELEPIPRGLYAGAVGYVDFAGNLDFCIAIRTIIMSNGKAWAQAGAGIVIDSNPTAEYEETRDKARALLKALELAQQGL